MKMKHQEIYQLLKYRRQELCSRLESIKTDFDASEDMDDVLFNIAHETKVELAQVKVALEEIENQTYGYCKECKTTIDEDILCENPLQSSCTNCAEPPQS